MQEQYEAPELHEIGYVNDVVLGSSAGGVDMPGIGAPDFEFEQD